MCLAVLPVTNMTRLVSSCSENVYTKRKKRGVNTLLLLFLENPISIELRAAKGLLNEIDWLALEEPTKSHDTLGNSTEMVEKRRRSVILANIVDLFRGTSQISKKFSRLAWIVRLLRLCGDENISTLSFEGAEDCFCLEDRFISTNISPM